MKDLHPYHARPEKGYASIMVSFTLGALLLLTGFFAGWYWQQTTVSDLVSVQIMPHSEPRSLPISTPTLEETGVKGTIAEVEEPGEPCLFVGSQNSNKYHNPKSAPAKRIKEENKVCFPSEEAALEAGYSAGTLQE